MRHPNRQVLDQDSIRATPRECTPLHSLRPSQSSTGDDSSDGVALSCGWVGGGRGGSEERRSLGESERGGASNCGSEGCAAGAHGRSRLRLGARLKMVYHSSAKVDPETQLACSCPLLPLKSHIRGPAPAAEPGSTDIIDEAINFFRANVLFRKFDVKGPADKLLVYLTLYINMALKRIEACKTEADGVKAIINLGLEKFPLPGEPGFPLGGLFTASQTKDEGELFRNYFKQVREETSGRLMERVYRQNGTPNKWWLAFANRKFMNIMMLL